MPASDRTGDGEDRLPPPRGDPTDRAQAEQALADADQRLAERERELTAREQALTGAELEPPTSDPARREEEELDRARARSQIATERDEIAAARDRHASERDRHAGERDRDAEIRAGVRARMQRDTLAAGHPLIELADAEQAALAADRRAAAAERAAAAAARHRAAEDRDRAATVRAEAMRHRERLNRVRGRVAFDPLTGARGRELGLRDLEREVGRARRELGALVVAYVDVDGLGAVNATEGADAGDAVLVAVATAIEARMRGHDLLVRIGGDEFLCVLAGLGIEQARGRFGIIGGELARGTPAVTIDVGFAALSPDDAPEDVVERARAGLRPRP